MHRGPHHAHGRRAPQLRDGLRTRALPPGRHRISQALDGQGHSRPPRGRTDAPLIDGRTSTKAREEAFERFRQGEIRTLVVSKVANFSIDLPQAAVGIQVSGTFGSRQEEAQRLGRLLRPKPDSSEVLFYTVVTRDTLDAEYAMHRQRFLAEQGYAYRIMDASDLKRGL